jgi:hypothetical protein
MDHDYIIPGCWLGWFPGDVSRDSGVDAGIFRINATDSEGGDANYNSINNNETPTVTLIWMQF